MPPSPEKYYDIVVIGAGIAGASVAYHLSQDARVAVVEMEQQPGYHTTGRSAAIFSETFGPGAIRALTSQSRAFFEDPPNGFCDGTLLSPRGVLIIARADQQDELQQLNLAVGTQPGVRLVDPDEIRSLVPLLRGDTFVSGILEETARDIDVNRLHQGFLRGVRQSGGAVLPDTEIRRLERDGSHWRLHARNNVISAPIVVNAAGAWAEQIGALAGAAPIGLVPKRRTVVIAPVPVGTEAAEWPAVGDVGKRYYLKPDSGRFLLSPSDETPDVPCDVQPDELDVAICVDRIEKAFDYKVPRIENSWAGLRSFVADQLPVCGFDPRIEGFFWLAGQGGYGIQSSPALSQLAATQITGSASPEGLAERGFRAEDLSPSRFADP